MQLTNAQKLVLHDMEDKTSLWRFQSRFKVTLRALQRKGVIAFNGSQYEITGVGRAALNGDSPQKCGGGLHSTQLGNPGDRTPCPRCGKLVTLRMPFNGHQTMWVQVPRHTAAQSAAQAATEAAA